MKKSIILGIGLIAAMSSCNDFLDISPDDTFINTPSYWSNSCNLDNQCNHFLNNYVGYGNAGGGGWFYFKTLSDDQVSYQDNLWSYTNVVSASSNWSNPLTEIRRASYIIQGLKSSTLSETVKASYEGIARLNRAWQYYQFVREYGDVPWVGHVVSTDDNDVLYGPRVDRDIVMDSVLNDLDFAAKHIQGSNKQRFTADMALAMKAQSAMNAGQWDEAIAGYKKAIAINDKDALVLTYLGFCLNSKAQALNASQEQKSLYAQSKVYLEKARDLDPNKERANWSYPLYQCYYTLYGADDSRTKEMEKMVK